MTIKPLYDRVVVEADVEPDQTKVGVLIPESAKKQQQTGVVVATGPGTYHFSKLFPMWVNIGDRVVFQKYAGFEIECDGKKLLSLKESDIIAVVD